MGNKQKTEEITGGDLGFVISRPTLSLVDPYSKYSALTQPTMYRRGILVQAKLKNRNKKWGKFSNNQKDVLPKRRDYLSLLLYSYADENRRNLEKFQWQLCKNHQFNEMVSWLNKGFFPTLCNSLKIIEGLGSDTIGTNDKQILDEVILAPDNPSLILDIDWPDGKRPQFSSWIRTRNEEMEMAKQLTY